MYQHDIAIFMLQIKFQFRITQIEMYQFYDSLNRIRYLKAVQTVYIYFFSISPIMQQKQKHKKKQHSYNSYPFLSFYFSLLSSSNTE